MSIDISQFLNYEFADSALYMAYRAIPSYIDGLKNSHRKIVYTIKKKNIKNELKVYQLASTVASESNYIHGDVSLQGAVVTLAQDYTGANNLPILKGEGNFGTRFLNEASAARYIAALPQHYFWELFKKEDDCNLISQNFEGDEIEPRFYVPSLPLLLLNGCIGIGVGFSTKILPRSKSNIEKAIKAVLEGKRTTKAMFRPSWNGFKGDVVEIAPGKWDIRGKLTVNGKKAIIDELPIPYSLPDYIAVLKKLKEKDIITKFTDLSEDDSFKFEVVLTEEEAKKDFDTIFNDLKLSNIITESFTCVDENNAIREFDSVKDVFDAYMKIRVEYLEKRIKSETLKLENELSNLEEIYKFINEVIKDTINLKDKRANVEKVMRDKGYTIIDKLLAMPLYSITKEKAEEAKKKYQDKKEELRLMKLETPTSQWLKDLEAF